MAANSKRIEMMRTKIVAALDPVELEIIDDSARHAGHAGASTGLGHFKVKIASLSFAGKSSIQCHRLVYQALGQMMETDIHALNIQVKNIKVTGAD